MDSLANDVANVNTPGYKHLRVGFRDLIYQQSGRGSLTSVVNGSTVASSTTLASATSVFGGATLASGSTLAAGSALAAGAMVF